MSDFLLGGARTTKRQQQRIVSLLFWMRQGRLVPKTKLAVLGESAKRTPYLYTLVLGNPMLGPCIAIWLSQTNRNL